LWNCALTHTACMAAMRDVATWSRAALEAAARTGDVEFIQSLLREEHATDPAGVVLDEEGTTACVAAAQAGQLEVLLLLLQHAADPAAMMMHTSIGGVTALMIAAESGRVALLARAARPPVC
jgi:ankyrin repeat protein